MTNRRTLKRVRRGFFKFLWVVAGLVAILVPLRTGDNRFVVLCAVILGAACFFVWKKLDSDPEISDVWPPRENSKSAPDNPNSQ